MTPKVSIIVPCWGVEKYLNQTVSCLVNQSLKNIEIILIDDESPDKVPIMCDEWADKDARIKVVHKNNAGLGMACNSGLEIATGEFVAFCDSDDWVETEAYETMYNMAVNHNADMIMTSFKYVDMEGRPFKKNSLTYNERTFQGRDIHIIMKGIIASAPTCTDERSFQASAKVTLFRNTIIKNYKLLFVSERVIPSEDLIFNLDYLSHCGTVITLPEKFYNYRYNPNSITHSVKRDTFNISKNLYLYLRDKVTELGLGEDGIHRVQRMFIGTTRATVGRILNSSITFSEKKKMLDEICKDTVLKAVAKEYPIGFMPLKHRLFFLATIWNQQLLLNLMTKFVH